MWFPWCIDLVLTKSTLIYYWASARHLCRIIFVCKSYYNKIIIVMQHSVHNICMTLMFHLPTVLAVWFVFPSFSGCSCFKLPPVLDFSVIFAFSFAVFFGVFVVLFLLNVFFLGFVVVFFFFFFFGAFVLATFSHVFLVTPLPPPGEVTPVVRGNTVAKPLESEIIVKC